MNFSVAIFKAYPFFVCPQLLCNIILMYFNECNKLFGFLDTSTFLFLEACECDIIYVRIMLRYYLADHSWHEDSSMVLEKCRFG